MASSLPAPSQMPSDLPADPQQAPQLLPRPAGPGVFFPSAQGVQPPQLTVATVTAPLAQGLMDLHCGFPSSAVQPPWERNAPPP